MSETTAAAGFATLAIHAGAQADLACDAMSLQVVPVFADAMFGAAGRSAAMHPVAMHPVAMLEERIATLEGGTAAVATASGFMARVLALRTLMRPGDELVAARNSDAGALETTLSSFGWKVRWAAREEPGSFVDALSDRTKALLVDSIDDVGGTTDIETIATIARRARVPLIVDNTVATPYLVRPFEHGADIVLHTSTALLAGNAGAHGGLVVDGGSFIFADDDRFPALSQPSPSHGGLILAETYGNFAVAMAARLDLRDLGAAPSALDAVLAAAGVETLALRTQRHCDSALAIARHLERHEMVAWVRYAGLERDAGYATRDLAGGAGPGLAFGVPDAAAVALRFRLIARGAGAGGTRSLCLCQDVDAMRLWIGLEEVADIVADLDQALAG